MAWRESLLDRGYAHFRGVVPARMIDAARTAISKELRQRYDPSREAEYSSGTYCPNLVAANSITNLIQQPPVRDIVDAAVPFDSVISGGAQIAIRWAHNVDREIPPEPHLDGVSPGLITNITAIVGVFLTPTPRAFAGNLTVWPGTHQKYEQYFRERGPRSVFEPLPSIDLGVPQQLLTEPGDVVLMHWALAHTAAVNTSDVDRIAVYDRLLFPDLQAEPTGDLADGRWKYLSSLWKGWRIGDAA